jgi:Flp pilus assembly protein TadD
MPDVTTLTIEAKELAKKQDWPDALERYKAALALDPHNADLHFLLGCCYFKMNRGPDARKAWDRTLALAPGHEKARVWIHRVTGLNFETVTTS